MSIKDVLNVVKNCEVVNFVSINEDGIYPESRTLINTLNRNIDDIFIYFITDKNSHKVQQIKQNPYTSLYYFDINTRKAVTLFGLTDILEDTRKKKFWDDSFTQYGYKDQDDDNYCILRFSIKSYKYYINKKEEIRGWC